MSSSWGPSTRSTRAASTVQHLGRGRPVIEGQVGRVGPCPEPCRRRRAETKVAGIGSGEVVLDVGAGDGLIAFGAMTLVGESGRVIFCDVSDDLLDHCRFGVRERNGVIRTFFRPTGGHNNGSTTSTGSSRRELDRLPSELRGVPRQERSRSASSSFSPRGQPDRYEPALHRRKGSPGSGTCS
jgi:hypothetical protein